MSKKSIKISENITKTYGQDKFDGLLVAFEQNIADSVLAKQFEVSRQRIHQWKQALGSTKIIYTIDPEVLKHRKNRINGKVTI